MAAVDNGWEIPPQLQDGRWLYCQSSRQEGAIWLGVTEEERFILAADRAQIIRELSSTWPIWEATHPGAGAISLQSLGELGSSVRRAGELARSLPDSVAHAFRRITNGLPRRTEAEQWAVRRIGQNLFRDALIEYWEGRCAVTKLAMVAVLRASHIKPWADCESDEERLDVYNGLLLAPQIDALFDGGWIGFNEQGAMLVAPCVEQTSLDILGIDADSMRLSRIEAAHRDYLRFHQQTRLAIMSHSGDELPAIRRQSELKRWPLHNTEQRLMRKSRSGKESIVRILRETDASPRSRERGMLQIFLTRICSPRP